MEINPRELGNHYRDIRSRLRGGVIKDRPSPVVVRPDPIRVTARFGNAMITSQAIVSWGKFNGPSIANIIGAVCKYFNVEKIDLVSDRRSKDLVRARQVAMYLSRKLTTASYPTIGNKLGGRDHTTVMHGTERIRARIKTEPELQDAVEFLTRTVMGTV